MINEKEFFLVPCGFLNYNIIFDAQVPPQGFQTIPPVIRNSQVCDQKQPGLAKIRWRQEQAWFNRFPTHSCFTDYSFAVTYIGSILLSFGANTLCTQPWSISSYSLKLFLLFTWTLYSWPCFSGFSFWPWLDQHLLHPLCGTHNHTIILPSQAPQPCTGNLTTELWHSYPSILWRL